MMCNELRQSFALLPGGPEPRIRVAKPSQSRVNEFIRRRSLPSGALSVEGPTKNKLRRTIMLSSYPSEPMVNKRGLPDSSPGNNGNDVDFLLRPGTIQKGDILLSAKKFASVTGNRANEILPGASLAGGLRLPTRKAIEGIFCRLSRVILRPMSIASVTVGTAFKSSVGF